MKKSIINLDNNIDYTKEPLFLGKPLNIQRYDVFRYKRFYQSYLNQLSFFWRPEEVHLGGKEKNDFNSLSEHEKFIFTSNLKYQILLDSVQARGISYLAQFVSNNELEATFNGWQFFEQLHSYAYTYIIKNVYPSPEEIFDHILDDPEIVKRAVSVTKYYDAMINHIQDPNTFKELKKKIYLTLVSINILEGIRFYVSFSCSFAFAQNKKMEGNAKIISLILRDENLHLGFTQSIIRLWRTEPSEGFMEIAEECEETVYQMYRDSAEEESEWAKYLFSKGNGMLGLNDEILMRYMKFMTNKRLRGIGLKHIFENATNPIPWIDSWTESKDVANAPQETELESYKVGSYIQDLEDQDWRKEFDNKF